MSIVGGETFAKWHKVQKQMLNFVSSWKIPTAGLNMLHKMEVKCIV